MRLELQKVCQHEARYQLLATDTCNQFLHYWDTSLGATVGQKFHVNAQHQSMLPYFLTFKNRASYI